MVGLMGLKQRPVVKLGEYPVYFEYCQCCRIMLVGRHATKIVGILSMVTCARLPKEAATIKRMSKGRNEGRYDRLLAISANVQRILNN